LDVTQDLFAVELGSQLATSCLDSIFEQVANAQDSLQVAQFLPFDTPEWRDDLWHRGLNALVNKARVKFSSFYTDAIRQSVGKDLMDTWQFCVTS
jgi:hypothetical protein